MPDEMQPPQGGYLGNRFLKCGAKILLAVLKQIPAVGMAAELADDGIEAVEKFKEEQERHNMQERILQLEEAMQYNCEQARAIAREVIAEARADGYAVPDDKAAAVEDMMAVMPSHIAQRLSATISHAKRKGTSMSVLPLDAASSQPGEQARFYQGLLPLRRPKYQVGQAVPHKTSWVFDGLLGMGGFGEVWKIQHKLLEQKQALKLCLENESSRMLKQEARTIATLQKHLSQHPNIVSVLDANIEEEPYWIALEYIPGGTLDNYIRSFAGPMPVEEALTLFAGICQGMQAAHELKIVHRDIKPANILLDSNHQPKIADFGLGKIMAEKAVAISTKRSRSGEPLTMRGYGTEMYMSPEQRAGNESDPSDDVYALGATLYHMMIGNTSRDPHYFRADLRKLSPQPPAGLTDLLADCLELPRGERLPNAGALLTRLQAIHQGSQRSAVSANVPIPKLGQAISSAQAVAPIQAGKKQAAQKPSAQGQAVQAQAIQIPVQAALPAQEVAKPRAKPSPAEVKIAVQQSSSVEPKLVEFPSVEPKLVEQPSRMSTAKATGKKGRRFWVWMGAVVVVLVMLYVFVVPDKINITNQYPPSIANITGFTYLREATYSCGGITHRMREYRHNQTGMEFVLIPGGVFSMGSSWYEGTSDERPLHTVTLSPYLISKTEVTQGVWRKIMGNNPSDFPKGDDHPVENVSWDDCQSFCQKTGLKLPSEAQWEFAARGGNSGKWCHGDNESGLSQYAWYGGSGTHYPVAQKSPNAYGIYDMHGNVWEWCQDWSADTYSSGSVTNPEGPNSGQYRVLRGGSWYYGAGDCRSAYRLWNVPGDRSSVFGFRCVFQFQ